MSRRPHRAERALRFAAQHEVDRVAYGAGGQFRGVHALRPQTRVRIDVGDAVTRDRGVQRTDESGVVNCVELGDPDRVRPAIFEFGFEPGLDQMIEDRDESGRSLRMPRFDFVQQAISMGEQCAAHGRTLTQRSVVAAVAMSRGAATRASLTPSALREVRRIRWARAVRQIDSPAARRSAAIRALRVALAFNAHRYGQDALRPRRFDQRADQRGAARSSGRRSDQRTIEFPGRRRQPRQQRRIDDVSANAVKREADTEIVQIGDDAAVALRDLRASAANGISNSIRRGSSDCRRAHLRAPL